MFTPQNPKRRLSNPLKLSIYKIDHKGYIFNVNATLAKKTCSNKNKLIGKNHTILKHNDMPEVVKKIITENLNKETTYFSVNKNCGKNNLEFWTLNYYKPINGVGYEIKMLPLPKRVKNVFIKLFNKLNKIEKNSGIETAKKFINGFFEYKKVSNLQEFIFSLYGIDYNKISKSINKKNTSNINTLQHWELKYK